MAVRYDALLARALAQELHLRYVGEPVAALGLHSQDWISAIVFSGRDVLWSFLHPRAGQIFAGEGSPIDRLLEDRSAWRRALKSETASVAGWRWHLFRSLRVARIHAAPDERLVLIDLAARDRDARFRVALELPRNRRNVILVDLEAGETIRSALRPRARLGPGREFPMPVGRRAGMHAPLGIEEWKRRLSGDEPAGPRAALLGQVAYASPLNADYIFRDRDLELAHERYLEILRGEARWMLHRAWGQQPYVHDLGDEDAISLKTIDEGMARSATEEGIETPIAAATLPSPAAERLASALRAQRKRLRRRIDRLESELEAGEAPDHLREQGHLLLAHMKQVPRGASRVELTDFEGRPRTIRLDPALGPADNADRYYRAAARRERALDRLPGLVSEAMEQAEQVEAGLRRLAETGVADPEILRLAGVSSEGPGRSPEVEGARRPYRRFTSSGGLEIRVGRSSKENDDLTFRHSSPDDIWLHARQVPGAHVILRWGQGKQNPPQRDLREAAVLAAVHSDARRSGVVAVDWTRRKYVRKPRKAGPGRVTAERLETVFVEPDPDAVQQLSPTS